MDNRTQRRWRATLDVARVYRVFRRGLCVGFIRRGTGDEVVAKLTSKISSSWQTRRLNYGHDTPRGQNTSRHQVTLYSRNGQVISRNHIEVGRALEGVKGDAVIDGELVALDENGVSHFQLGANGHHGTRMAGSNSQKGYGFIQPTDGGKDVFVHISAVERSGLNGLNEGQKINYEIATERGRSAAVNLKAAE